MALHASWIHGNDVTVENPENLLKIGHFGWGKDVSITPGKASWFHIAIPTPVIVADTRTKIQKLFLLFETESCEIRNVHIWDGPNRIQTFDGVHLKGKHRTGIDATNTFNLSAPHTVLWGMSISFFVQAAIGIDSPITTRLIVSTAGGDFTT